MLHNNSPQSLPTIMLRLDHNIFRPRVPFAPSWLPGEITDGMVITKLAVNGDGDRPGAGGRRDARRRRGRAPARRHRAWIARWRTITLAEPIAPKGQATLEIGWRTKLPSGPGSGHRMMQRYEDRLFQPTQWYPRVAKYDDLRGWDTNLYLGPSEFYNNFGRFDVRIDVPAGWIVSGTGVLQNPQDVLTAKARERLSHVLESDEVITIVGDDEVGPGQATAAGDRLVWHLVADMVNDFAWATAQEVHVEGHARDDPRQGARADSHGATSRRARRSTRTPGRIARHALEFYSKLWAPYPFPQLTLQDGPSTGMEYPMVINSNQGAADHETGHQWWPMMVGNNETWYGWMDEGFNQYMNILSDADAQRAAAPT